VYIGSSAGSEVVTAELPILSTPEIEGRNWWAGFLLHMTKGLHEWMGARTRDATNVTQWMALKSRGGAYMPSAELNEFLELAEEHFKSVHGSELSIEKDPIGKVSSLLRTARPDVDPEIIGAYSKSRFFLRLNDLNNKLQVRETQQRRRQATHANKYI